MFHLSKQWHEVFFPIAHEYFDVFQAAFLCLNEIYTLPLQYISSVVFIVIFKRLDLLLIISSYWLFLGHIITEFNKLIPYPKKTYKIATI